MLTAPLTQNLSKCSSLCLNDPMLCTDKQHCLANSTSSLRSQFNHYFLKEASLTFWHFHSPYLMFSYYQEAFPLITKLHLYLFVLGWWWKSGWAISNPERWCCESAALNMPANVENSSGHRTGKGQFSFQSQRKAMPKNAQTSAQLHSSHTLVK